MPKTAPFDTYHDRYDSWFSDHRISYHSELLALRAFVPWQGFGLEIGVGTGRFAAPLGVAIGIDPSRPMLKHAVTRGIAVAQACGETLPFDDAVFDYTLIVTTICFVDDVCAVLAETHRVLKPAGCVVIGFIDRASALAQRYLMLRDTNVFYHDARFYSASEVEELLHKARFEQPLWGQTLSKSFNEPTEIEPVKPGYGKGAFVVVKAQK